MKNRKPGSMKKKIIFIACFICLFTVSDIGSTEFGYVFVVVRDRFYNPISWVPVLIDNQMCWSIGYGYYRGTTWPGWHCVSVCGRVYWIYVESGGYKWVYAYL